MGCDIHTIVEKQDDGEWSPLPYHPFEDGRSYALFGWLADVRNYSAIQPISEPRGFPQDFNKVQFGYEDPDDMDWHRGGYPPDYHSASWVTVEELLAVDYEQIVEDRRTTKQLSENHWTGAWTCEPGEGEKMTLREFLGESYFRHLDKLREMGAERIVFCFDN